MVSRVLFVDVVEPLLQWNWYQNLRPANSLGWYISGFPDPWFLFPDFGRPKGGRGQGTLTRSTAVHDICWRGLKEWCLLLKSCNFRFGFSNSHRSKPLWNIAFIIGRWVLHSQFFLKWKCELIPFFPPKIRRGSQDDSFNFYLLWVMLWCVSIRHHVTQPQLQAAGV